MARTPITLKTLPGSSPAREIVLNHPTEDYPLVRKWSCQEVERGGGYSEDYYGAIAGTVGRMTKQLTLDCILDDATLRQVRSLRASAEPFAVSPPWDGADTLCHLSLQQPVDAREPALSETRVKAQRTAAAFARYSTRFNPVTGLPADFHVPLYTAAAWDGQSANIGDVINDTHHPSFVKRAKCTANAANGATDTTCYFGKAVDVADWFVGQFVMVSTSELATNIFELARVKSISTATKTLTLETTAGGAVLVNTASYTYRNRTYVQGFGGLVSDCEMEDSGLGSWAAQGTPTIREKSETMQETGSRCLRISGDVGEEGVYQTLGYVPAGTDMVLWVRAKQLQCSGASWLKMQVYNVTDAVAALTQHAPVADTAWTWYRYCFEVARGGAGQKQLKLQLMTSIGGGDEALIDRVYIFQNGVDNGGMEGAYAGGVAPGWTQVGAGTPTESADEHGGDKAQQQTNSTAAKYLYQNTAIVTGAWYYFGGYAKQTTGGGNTLITTAAQLGGLSLTTTAGEYALLSGVARATATGNHGIYIYNSADAVVGLWDDIMILRLPGNPYDDCYYDLPEPLSTTGFTVFGCLVPAIDSTNLTTGNYYYWTPLGRRKWDGNNALYLYYRNGELRTTLYSGGAGPSRTDTFAFSASDSIYYAVRVSGAAGSQKIKTFYSINGAAIAGGESAATGTTPAGITRAWLLRYPTAVTSSAGGLPGSLSSILIENTALSDADVEALLNTFARASGYENRHALLDETYGRLWQLTDNGIEVQGPARGYNHRCRLTFREIDRIGALAVGVT